MPIDPQTFGRAGPQVTYHVVALPPDLVVLVLYGLAFAALCLGGQFLVADGKKKR